MEINRENEEALDWDYLQEVLDYDEYTGIFIWKKQLSSRGPVGKEAGYKGTYIIISINGIRYRAHRLAWFYIYAKWPSILLDHKDRNKHNNTLRNLKEATNSENSHNTEETPGCWKVGNKYRAAICLRGKRKYIGYFNTKEEASSAYSTEKQRIKDSNSN
jgi:hypothetical protein